MTAFNQEGQTVGTQVNITRQPVRPISGFHIGDTVACVFCGTVRLRSFDRCGACGKKA